MLSNMNNLFFFSCTYMIMRFSRKKNARKTPEKSKTRAQREKKFLYYTVHWVKRESVAFWSRFGRVLVAFCPRFALVLPSFCPRFAHKPYQNANPMHSVIWP